MPSRDPEHLTTRYMKRFQCIGEACEENCCKGWSVAIDEPSYRRLKRAMKGTKQEREEFHAAYRREDVSPHARGSFAVVKLDHEGNCRFLDPQRLCSAQARYGHEVLSDTCAVYPRALSLAGEQLEMTGAMSCPEIARQVLLRDDALELVPLELAEVPRAHITQAHAVGSFDPYERHLGDVRTLVLSLLENRRYPVAARLFFVSYFAKRTTAFFRRGGEGFDEHALLSLCAEMTRAEVLDRWYEHFLRMPAQPAVPTRLVLRVIAARLRELPASSFRVLLGDILRPHATGGTLEGDAPAQVSIQAVMECYRERRAQLGELERRLEQYFENYARNYWLREWFTKSPDLLVHAQALLVRLTVVRVLIMCHPELTFTVAAGSEARASLLDRVAVEVFYRFSRGVEHSAPFLAEIGELIKAEGLEGLPASVMLARF